MDESSPGKVMVPKTVLVFTVVGQCELLYIIQKEINISSRRRRRRLRTTQKRIYTASAGTFFMPGEDGDRACPPWAEKHIQSLARIYDKFALGQAGIIKFMNDKNLTQPEYGYQKIIETFPSSNFDEFHDMLDDEPIRAFRSSLEKLNEFPASILKSINRNRGIKSQFPPEVRALTSLEGSLPDALFSVKGEGFPLSRKELKERTTKCRRIYNTVRHIGDRRSDTPDRYKRTYMEFFKTMRNLRIQDVTRLYVDLLKVLEYLESEKDGKLINAAYLETQVRRYTSNPLNFAKPAMMLRALKANTWNEYIEVQHKQQEEGEDEEELAIHQLDFLIRPEATDCVVEITGEGGLGKTKLAREYMIRSIKNELKYRYEPFLYYHYYTAKSDRQGEVKATIDGAFTTSPGNWKEGGGDYIHKLSFANFLQRMCTAFQLELTDAQQSLIDHLHNNEYLILLDNFEDVSAKDAAKYRKFFKKIEAGFKSKFIITSRKTPYYGRAFLALDRLSRTKAVEMLHKRYQFEFSQEGLEYRMLRINQLREAVKNDYDLIEIILQKVKPPENAPTGLEILERNLCHPLYIRLIANILAHPDTLKETAGIQDITDAITHIINQEKYEFWKWHSDVSEWMLNHAYDQVKDDLYCRFILEFFLSTRRQRMERDELFQAFQNRFPEEDSLINIIETSIDKIISHRDLFDDAPSEDGIYFLSDSARKFLPNLLSTDAEAELEQEPTPVVDSDVRLNQLMISGISTWVEALEAADAMFEFQLQNRNDEQDLIPRGKKLLLEFLTHNQLSIETIEPFLRFVRLLNNRGAFDLLIGQMEFFAANSEALEGEEREFLARVITGLSKNTEDGHPPQIPRSGHTLILAMGLINCGIQQFAQPLFRLINALLTSLQPEELGQFLEEHNWHDDFKSFLDTNREVVEWSLTTQKLYDDYGLNRSEYDVPQKFCRVVRDMIDDYMIVEFHNDGLGVFNGPEHIARCVNWNQLDDHLILYVFDVPVQRDEKPKQSGGFDPTAFEKWTTGTTTGHPGFSIEPVALAADVHVVLETYRSSTFADDVAPLSRGQRLKRLVSQYHRGKATLKSVAFTIGFHLLRHEITLDACLETLRFEFCRRLDRHQDVSITVLSANDEHAAADIPAWKQHFQEILQKTKALLVPSLNEEVQKELGIRTQRIEHVQPPVKTKQKISQNQAASNWTLPQQIGNALTHLAGQAIIRKERFVENVIRYGGDLRESLQTEKTLMARNHQFVTSQTSNAWMESTVEYIFQRTKDWNKKYTETSKIIAGIEQHHLAKHG